MSGRTDGYTKAATKWITDMVWVISFGPMAEVIKDSGRRVGCTERESIRTRRDRRQKEYGMRVRDK